MTMEPNGGKGSASAVLEQVVSASSAGPPFSSTPEAPTTRGLTRQPSPSPSYRTDPPPTYNMFRTIMSRGATVRTTANITRTPKPTEADFVLRSMCLIFEGVGLILSGVAQHMSNNVYISDSGSLDFLGITAFGFSTLVSLCIMLGMLASRGKPVGKVHPGCIVAWDLLAWMLLLSIAIMYCILIAYYGSDNYFCYSGGNQPTCHGQEKVMRGCEIGGTVLMYLATIYHFCFFVDACRTIDHMRVWKKALMIQKEVARQVDFHLASRTPGDEVARPGPDV